MYRYKRYCDVLETVNNKMASDSRFPVCKILQLLQQKLEGHTTSYSDKGANT